MTGTLFIVAAPSGAGKTSLVKALLDSERGIALSVSYTSRAPRPGETDGVHYHFVSRAVFEAMVERGEFLEHAVVHGDLKGTARAPVEAALRSGQDVLLEIDWQGARQVRTKFSGAVSAFILPPSRAELERRLRARASDSADVIARRLADSRVDVMHAEEFDFLIVNDTFEAALADLVSVVRSQRLRCSKQRKRHAALFDDLLKTP